MKIYKQMKKEESIMGKVIMLEFIVWIFCEIVRNEKIFTEEECKKMELIIKKI